MTTNNFPQYQSILVSVSLAGQDAPATEIRQKLASPIPLNRHQSGGCGCVTLILRFPITVAAARIVEGFAKLTVVNNFPAQGLHAGVTGIYSGLFPLSLPWWHCFRYFMASHLQ